MLVHVVERLLRDAVDVRLHFRAEPLPVHADRVELRADAVRVGPRVDEVAQRGHDPHVEDGGTQVGRHEVQLLLEIVEQVLHVGDLRLDARRRQPRECRDLELERGHLLSDVVVQVACDALPLLFVRLQQPPGEGGALACRLVAFDSRAACAR